MKRYNKHERAVERKLDEIIKLLTTQQRNTEHVDERFALIREQYKKGMIDQYREALGLGDENETDYVE